MKKTIPIPGEKQEIRKALEEAEKKFGKLPKQERRRIINQVHKKAVRRAKIIGMLAALGLTTAVAGTKMLNSGKDNTQIEQEESTAKQRHSEFVNIYKEEIETEQRTYVDEINDLETREEELAYLKKLYVEAMQHEMPYNNTTLDPNDIQITYNYEDYLYIDITTGDLFTHGDYPKVTREQLKNKYGIDVLGFGDNEIVYKVRNKDGKIIDCASFQNIDGDGKTKCKKVYVADDYTNTKSILTTMGTVVQSGISYYERFGDKVEKQIFIKAVGEWKESMKQEDMEKTQEDSGEREQ